MKVDPHPDSDTTIQNQVYIEAVIVSAGVNLSGRFIDSSAALFGALTPGLSEKGEEAKKKGELFHVKKFEVND